jgi:hypothetical protein
VTAATILYDGSETEVDMPHVEGEDLWLGLQDLRSATGWELKPHGVCRGEVCVPLPAGRRHEFVGSDGGPTFNLAAFAHLVDQPYAVDGAHGVWCFAAPRWEWQAGLEGKAADFTLPDLEGRPRSLSDQAGKKVFLVFWASW